MASLNEDTKIHNQSAPMKMLKNTAIKTIEKPTTDPQLLLAQIISQQSIKSIIKEATSRLDTCMQHKIKSLECVSKKSIPRQASTRFSKKEITCAEIKF
ncbi:hypothetical protein CDL12_23998 [Handroanthus impetiginosus]|uniref:Uncharacterized protein n=1 Tax=Handroanthus impetiginosus TaxID=429701 RepID=A0A2G9GDW7_9LAMI|nr:hypothetical protein CDL12_23998 [Handroanthus impetiginosus]